MSEELIAPVMGPVFAPAPWLVVQNFATVRWQAHKARSQDKCIDCMRCILDKLEGRWPDDRPAPGLGRKPTFELLVDGESYLLCSDHQALRTEESP